MENQNEVKSEVPETSQPAVELKTIAANDEGTVEEQKGLLETVHPANSEDQTTAYVEIVTKTDEVKKKCWFASAMPVCVCIKPFRGYVFGFLFATFMCCMNLFVKMAPALDGSNHAMIRYAIQLIAMSVVIKVNKLPFFGPVEQRKLLLLRGTVGSLAVIIGFFSIRYLDVSDVETLNNSCVIITAVFSRIFLKEKLAVGHIVALFMTIAGVVFIIRPSFLFGIEHDFKDIFLHKTPHNMTFNGTSKAIRSLIDKQKAHIKDHSNREMVDSVLGVMLVLISACCMSIAQVSIRALCLVKVHFSITSIYPAMVGLPISFIVSCFFFKFKFIQSDTYESSEFIIQLIYSLCGGVFGTLGLVSLNLALQHEDATKIGMLKTNVGIFLAFLLQYIVLDIDIDTLGLLGAVFVILATLSVLMLKLFDVRLAESKNRFVQLIIRKF